MAGGEEERPEGDGLTKNEYAQRRQRGTMARVKFSSALKSTTGETQTKVDAATVGDALDKLTERYGDEFESKIREDGEVRRFINIYVSGEDITHLEGLDTALDEDDEISILPAVAGG